MNLSPDDPRLTAFALGELDDPAEAKQIEAAVAASPELQEAVAEIRATGAALEEALRDEPAPELTRAEKATFYPAASARTSSGSGKKLYLWPWLAAAAAAVALVAYVTGPMSSTSPAREVHASASDEESPEPPREQAAAGTDRAGESLSRRQADRAAENPPREFGDFTEPHLTEPGETLALRSREEPEREMRRQPSQPKTAPAPPTSPGTPEAASEPTPERQSERYAYSDADTSAGLEADVAESSAAATAVAEQVGPSPDDPEDRVRELLRLGRSQYINGDLVAAEQTFRAVLAIDPDNTEAKAFLERIGNDKRRRERLDRAGTRAEMLESVSSSWQRPAVYHDRAERESPQLQGPARTHDDIRLHTKPWNTDAFDPIEETGFRSPLVAPFSTFSIDVDTASYAKVRSFLNEGRLPPASAVRIEELVNYFPYDDAPPSGSPEEGGHPFAVHLEQAAAPWAPEHRLLRVNLKGYELPWDQRPPSNLVFLLDVSGSMNQPNRLPLVKEALNLLVNRLDERDRVAIVVYAGSSGLALPSTTANNTETIRHAIDQLGARGSTNAGDGIQRAYAAARRHFIEDGNNRVILCTDGDFNVGITDRGELGTFVQKQADEGISLAVLGFGMGNYKDNMLEELSTKGKGPYAYIDTADEARKFFLQQLTGNLFTIARDVKIQVELNPAEVKAYRLIGYENRLLKTEDFNDDTKRAGDIGPGHTVTAYYELVPSGADLELPEVDERRYQVPAQPAAADGTGELATVKLRYKRPGVEESELIVEHVSAEAEAEFAAASTDFRFGAAVAAFGMRLRGSEHIGDFGWPSIRRIARDSRGPDSNGHRMELLDLIDRAERLGEKEN